MSFVSDRYGNSRARALVRDDGQQGFGPTHRRRLDAQHCAPPNRPVIRSILGTRRRKSYELQIFGQRGLRTHLIIQRPASPSNRGFRFCRTWQSRYLDQHRRAAGCAVNQTAGSSAAAAGGDCPDNWTSVDGSFHQKKPPVITD
jgi:hypothetical protein